MAVRVVAFLDVLGFKSLVRAVPHTDLVRIYERLQEVAHLQTVIPVFPDDHRRWDADAYYAPEEISHERTANVAIASDSIVIYSQDLSRPADMWAGSESSRHHRDVGAVLAAVRGLLVAGFREGIPLRGAVALGDLDELVLQRETVNAAGWTARFDGLIGMALVSAYELEGQSDWSGAILASDLVEFLEGAVLSEHDDGSFTLLDACLASRLLVNTLVPTKRRDNEGEETISSEARWVVNWPFLCGHIDWRVQPDEVARAFESFGRPADARTMAKRLATLEFMGRAEADSEAARTRRSS